MFKRIMQKHASTETCHYTVFISIFFLMLYRIDIFSANRRKYSTLKAHIIYPTGILASK